jgi:hypothetical protein
MLVTTRTAIALLGPIIHATRWAPLAATIAVGLAIVALPAALSAQLTTGTLTTLLRLAAVCCALGTAFLLDDPAAGTTATVATPRLLRSLVRVVVVLPVLATAWTITQAIAVGATAENGAHLKLGALTIEAAALCATAVALAAARLHNTSEGTAGPFAAAALLLATAATVLLPDRIALLPAPTDPRWSRIHVWWTAILTIAVLGYLSAAVERLPSRKRRLRSLLRRRPDAVVETEELVDVHRG